MHVTLLTDIPIWVEPLLSALRKSGARVACVSRPSETPKEGLLVNRVSARLARRQPPLARELADFLKKQEATGRALINGSRCLQLGHDKLAQADLFREAGGRTPETARAVPGGRAFPDVPVLLKPPAGGYGKGILRLESGEPAPTELFAVQDNWIEQKIQPAADNAIHRMEFLGNRILYDASSPIQEGNYDYCLASGEQGIHLLAESEIAPGILETARRIARHGGLEFGSIEYLLDDNGEPVFIDFNPVSSLHPGAQELLGADPTDLIAEFLLQRSSGLLSEST